MKKAAYLSFYSAIHATIKQKRNKNKSGASLGLEEGIQMDDHGIIELYWARNEQAIHETAAMYGRYCSTIARNIVKNSEDTEECVNDTYLRVWNSIPTDRPRIFKAYIGRITRNIALSLYRKTHAEKRGGGELELVFEELEGLISTRLGTEEILEDKEIAQAISTFLRREKEDARQLFVRRYWYTESIRDLAEDFGLTETNVKQKLFRTRNRLKQYLETEGIRV